MSTLPQDPAILFSLVNTWLRDEYDSLEELCASKDIASDELRKRLAAAGFEYNRRENRFW